MLKFHLLSAALFAVADIGSPVPQAPPVCRCGGSGACDCFPACVCPGQTYATVYADVLAGRYTLTAPAIVAVGVTSPGATCSVPSGYAGLADGVYHCYATTTGPKIVRVGVVTAVPAASGCPNGRCPVR